MLARRAQLSHPVAGNIDLPLLVPAFSSKGFKFIETKSKAKPRRYSEVAYELAEFGRRPADVVLISAYDWHYRYYCAPDLAGSPMAHLRNVRVALLDSGGYELASDFDSTEPRVVAHKPETFSEKGYIE